MIAVEPTPLVALPPDRTASDVLRAAARYIEEHGWLRGDFGGDGGPACVHGALIEIAYADHWGADDSPQNALYRAAVDRLNAFLGRGSMAWNDTPGRTEAEVSAALRAAAEHR